MSKIDLDYANALKLILPDAESISLTLVGCGGTGSWLAPAVARVGKLLIERFQKDVKLTFVDPDRVEEKNIYRQNFCAAEIGRNKAETLAYRFGLAWGLEIRAVPAEFSNLDWEQLAVVIGCVDNAAARRSIQEAAGSRAWWLDAGNTKNGGQVLLGLGGGKRADAFNLPGYCGWLPSPAKQHPELVEATPVEELEPTTQELSCAEMALQDSQGLAINQRMAAEAADYLVRMLITKDLRKYATYIDLESGTSQSKYISMKEMRRWMK